jgi:hypothetical protein
VPQITICPDKETAGLLDSARKAAGVSRSQWIGDAVRLRVRREWPASIRALASLAGCPDGSEIRRLAGTDIPGKRL